MYGGTKLVNKKPVIAKLGSAQRARGHCEISHWLQWKNVENRPCYFDKVISLVMKLGMGCFFIGYTISTMPIYTQPNNEIISWFCGKF